MIFFIKIVSLHYWLCSKFQIFSIKNEIVSIFWLVCPKTLFFSSAMDTFPLLSLSNSYIAFATKYSLKLILSWLRSFFKLVPIIASTSFLVKKWLLPPIPYKIALSFSSGVFLKQIDTTFKNYCQEIKFGDRQIFCIRS